ncbi:MAG: OB-fold domain-containing protein [Proteobacteria bacterium]|nr:OB-fold domain-containing protein [Pseudomonadota bacterium]MBU1450388.1 OB-fold domain-containing protein [Pseudomonadota bacterium]MBU2467390.1 OB-fold domain-containing protein [Pseudomonadota bacterium]MBU2516487.1 OB-fold domain-containing protein [Pseudomonadota bacterium]
MAKPEIDARFKKFGTVSFTATTKVNDFIDYLEKGQVAGTKCAKCGQVFFPPRADCFRCPGEAVEWFVVEGTGKLATFSELMYAPIGFGEDLPYAIAVLDYGDFKVFGRIGQVPFEDLTIGMDMVARANELPGGNLNYVFEKA